MTNFIKRLLCGWRGHKLTFRWNIYGDEINISGGNRSMWKCSECGAYKLKPELHNKVSP